MLRGQYPVQLIGSGRETRPFTYVDDAVAATVALFEEALAGNEKVLDTDFNISTPEVTKILDLAELIWKLYGDGREFKYVAQETSASKATSERREADIAKLRSVISCEPTISLEEGIRCTAEWVKSKIA